MRQIKTEVKEKERQGIFRQMNKLEEIAGKEGQEGIRYNDRRCTGSMKGGENLEEITDNGKVPETRRKR
jgi:hypothetical protein